MIQIKNIPVQTESAKEKIAPEAPGNTEKLKTPFPDCDAFPSSQSDSIEQKSGPGTPQKFKKQKAPFQDNHHHQKFSLAHISGVN